jgi:long-chain acyl-CoA synthetase
MAAIRLRDIWKHAAADYGAREYILSPEQRLTFAEFYEQIRRGALAIRANGWADSSVPLAADVQDPVSLALIIGACAEADASLAFMPEARFTPTTRTLLDAIGAKFLISDRDGFGECDWIVASEEICSAASIEGLDAANQTRENERGAFMLQTSGTEGEPRWVICRFEHCFAAIRGMQISGALEHARDRVVFLAPPLSHSYGLSTFLEYTDRANTIAFPGPDSALGPVGDLMRAEIREVITAIEGVPFFYSQLCKLISRLKLPILQHVGVGAGAWQSDVLTALSLKWNGLSYGVRYGLTETPSAVTHKVFNLPSDSASNGCGLVTGAYDIEIADQSGRGLPAGSEGEIIVRGDCVSPYLGTARNGQHTTGDIGFVDSNGELHVVGRNSVFLKYRGFRLSPEPIEAVLMGAPGVIDCQVRLRDEQLVAEVVTESAGDSDLIRHIANRLPAYCIPDRVLRVDKVLRTRSGKILRR